jgi:hypothetical protein
MTSDKAQSNTSLDERRSRISHQCPLLDQVVASLVAEMHHIQGILLAVVHNISRGVNLRRMHLEALRLIGSTITRWRDLGGGLLLVAAGPWSLGKLLGLGRGITRGSTNILMMF